MKNLEHTIRNVVIENKEDNIKIDIIELFHLVQEEYNKIYSINEDVYGKYDHNLFVDEFINCLRDMNESTDPNVKPPNKNAKKKKEEKEVQQVGVDTGSVLPDSTDVRSPTKPTKPKINVLRTLLKGFAKRAAVTGAASLASGPLAPITAKIGTLINLGLTARDAYKIYRQLSASPKNVGSAKSSTSVPQKTRELAKKTASKIADATKKAKQIATQKTTEIARVARNVAKPGAEAIKNVAQATTAASKAAARQTAKTATDASKTAAKTIKQTARSLQKRRIKRRIERRNRKREGKPSITSRVAKGAAKGLGNIAAISHLLNLPVGGGGGQASGPISSVVRRYHASPAAALNAETEIKEPLIEARKVSKGTEARTNIEGVRRFKKQKPTTLSKNNSLTPYEKQAIKKNTLDT